MMGKNLTTYMQIRPIINVPDGATWKLVKTNCNVVKEHPRNSILSCYSTHNYCPDELNTENYNTISIKEFKTRFVLPIIKTAF